MKSGKALTLFVLSSAGLTALAFLHTADAKSVAAAKPAADAPYWTVARPQVACGTDAESRVSACRFAADVTWALGAADHGVVTIQALDPAGRELGCWNGERLARSTLATTVHALAPAEVLGRAVAFEMFVSSWGCWGTPTALGPRIRVPRASAARDPAVVNEARERARQQLEEADEHGDPDPGRAWELGPVVPRPDGKDGC